MLLTATAPPSELAKMMALARDPLLLKASVDRPKTMQLIAEKSKYGSNVTRLPHLS